MKDDSLDTKSRKPSKGKGALFGVIIAAAVVLIIVGIMLIILNKDYITGSILVVAGFVIVAILNINKIHAKFMTD